MNWALKRQIFYIAVLILFVVGFGFLVTYPVVNSAPSCTDGKKNSSETGVDCGGTCARACVAEQDPIAVLWARAFQVVPGRYNAVAYLVNHNKNSAIKKINYRFRFGDENNVYIGKREGTTFVPPGQNFAVFEPGIEVGNSKPVYTTFEWTEAPAWLQVSDEKAAEIKVLVSNIELEETDKPRLRANLRNTSLFVLKNVDVVAILYEAGGNAVAASRSYIPELAPLQSKNVTFTWPEPFGAAVVEKEILPIVDVFSAKLK